MSASVVNQGLILNLTDRNALNTRRSIVDMTMENPDKMLGEIRSAFLAIMM
jgi:hypothetical protein